MRRWQQVFLWLLLAPLLGLVQGLASFFWLFLKDAQPAVWKLVSSIGPAYGTGWFLPTLLIADVGLIRRGLTDLEFRSFVLTASVIAASIGLFTPGMLLMISYPVTALAILLLGVYRRKHATQPNS